MPNKNYIRGREVEYKAQKQLEERGYTVYRCAGSHGLFDLIAFSTKDIKLVQCKRTKNKNTNYKKEVAMIHNFKNYPYPFSLEVDLTSCKVRAKISKELWVWTDRKGFDILLIGD